MRLLISWTHKLLKNDTVSIFSYSSYCAASEAD